MKGHKLVEAMREEMRRLNDRASLYRMAGEIEVSDDVRMAAHKLSVAINAMNNAISSEAEAKDLAA